MKKIVTQTGGHPLTLDDIEFTELSQAEAIEKGLGKAIGVDTLPRVLYGCEITTVSPTERQISDGWIFWSNNMLRVQGGTIFGTDPYIAFAPALLPVPGKPQKTYADSNVYDVYQDQFLITVSLAALGNPFVIYHQDLIPMNKGQWRDIGTTGQPGFNSGWENLNLGTYRDCGFRKNTGNIVELKGIALTNQTGFDLAVFQLPERFRPKDALIFTSASSFGDLQHVQVNPSGDVEIYLISNFTGNTILLDGISFEAAIT